VLSQVDDIDTIEALTLTCKSSNKAANERAAILLPQMAHKAMQLHLDGNISLSRIDKLINKLLVTEFNKINPDESTKQLVEVKQKPLPMATLKRIKSIRDYLEQIELLVGQCIIQCDKWHMEVYRQSREFRFRSPVYILRGGKFPGPRDLTEVNVRSKLNALKRLSINAFDATDSLEQYDEVVSRVQEAFDHIDPPEFMKAEFAELKDFICGVDSKFNILKIFGS